MTFCILIKDAIASKPVLRLPILSFLLRYKPMHHTRLQELWQCKKETLVFRVVVHFPFGIQSHCSFQFGIQSHIFISAFKAAFSIWHSESLFVSSSAFFAIIHFFGLAFKAASSFWRSKLHLHIGIQSRCLSLVQHLEPFFVWCSQLHFQFSVQSRIFILAFGATSSFWRSEPLFVFSSTSRAIFRLAFRAIVHFSFGIQSCCSFQFGVQSHIFSSAFRATFSFRHSEPLFQFGIQSYSFILAFKAIVCFQFNICSHHTFFQFGVQSCIFILAFRATSSSWSSKPHLHFGVQSHCLSLVRHLEPFFIWCLESHFQFGFQSRIFILAFRATSLFWISEPLFVFSLTTRAIFRLAFRVIVHFSLAFRAIFSV